jgi:hypothetical protein
MGSDHAASCMLGVVESIVSNVVSTSISDSGHALTTVDPNALSTHHQHVLPCTLCIMQAISASAAQAASPPAAAWNRPSDATQMPFFQLSTSSVATISNHNLRIQQLLLHHVHAMVKLCQQSSGHFNKVGNAWVLQSEDLPRYTADIVLCGRLAFMLQAQHRDWSGLLQALDVSYKTVRSTHPSCQLTAVGPARTRIRPQCSSCTKN